MLLLTNSLRMSWNHKDFKAQLLKHRYQAKKVSSHVFSVLHVPFLTRSTILLIEFGVVTTAWYLFAYHFMLQNINWKWPRLTPFVDKKKIIKLGPELIYREYYMALPGCDTKIAILYYVYHILKHEKVLFCIINL